MSLIKPQILAAISGAIAAYMADEEACQAAAGFCGRGPGPAGKPLGNVRAPGGHATQAADAAAEFAGSGPGARPGRTRRSAPTIIPPDP